ncbi:TonB-dependent receptor [Parabacteroides chinchillae]
MKNHKDGIPIPKYLLHIMRITFFLFFVGLIHVHAVSYAQKTQLTLKENNIELGDLLKKIEAETEFYFFYNNDKINRHKTVDINVENKTINEVLDIILKNMDVNYQINDKAVILSLKSRSVVQQENKQLSGTIVDEKGNPIIGANITVKGTTAGAITDIDGNFILSAPSGAVLSVSYIGYLTQEVSVGSKSIINVVLKEDVKALDELVVIGYGSVKKSDLTGSVQRLDVKVFKNQSMTQITDMLAGSIAGFNAVQSSSSKGGGSMEIRGRTSLNASREPMVVLDGAIFNGNLLDVNPQDVQSIEILKDASSSAIYGARAANGIVMITTKKGEKGKPMISFSAQLGVASPTNKFKSYDKDSYLSYKRDILREKNPNRASYYYDNPSNLPSGVTLDEWRNASDNPQSDNKKEWLTRLSFFPVEIDNYLNGKNVDWFDKAFESAVRQKYDVSISGGTENMSYFWSVDYQNNGGIIKGDDYSAIRTRLNFDFNITNWLNVGINAHFSDRDESSVAIPISEKNMSLYYMSPYGSEYNEDGTPKWYPNDFSVINPFLNYYEQDKKRKINSLFASVYANIKLPFNINYKISFQPNYSFISDYNFYPSTIPDGGLGGKGTRTEAKESSWIFDHLISWKRQFGVHGFDATFLYSAEQNLGWQTYAENRDFIPNENLGFSGLKFGTNPAVSANDTKTTADAIMGRITYSLMDRYLITASIRRDGYSAFGINNPRATFPAVALAWKISDESFFKIPNVYQLKLRASWGQNGNRDIGAYAALAQLTSVMYYNGGNVNMGIINSSLPNVDLKWERTAAYNFGIDLGLFDNRIDFTGDFYVMNTLDLLMERKLPEITGFPKIMTNLGELQNKGVELTLNTVNIDRENFRWTSNLVYSANRNKIVKLFGDYETVELNGNVVRREVPDYENNLFPGHAIDHIWNYKIDGIWQQNEADKAAVYRLSPGDWKAADVDDNGKYEALQDKQFIGYSEPRHRLGFRNSFTFFKNFNASLFFRADLGHKAPFRYALQAEGVDQGEKRNTFDIPYWTPENPINDYARLTTNTNVFGGGLMIYKSRSFLRLQDFSLSYSVPKAYTKQLFVNSLEVYYSGHNLFYFSKWPGWDPESLDTPMPRSHTFGVRVTL